MFRKMKIKSQIIASTAIILGVIIILQIFLYTILQSESNQLLSSVFDSITQNTVQQIEKLNDDIAEASSLLAVHRTTQANLYQYTPVEIIQNYAITQNLLNDYLSSNQNIAFLGLIKGRSLFMSSEAAELYDPVQEIIENLPEPKNADPIYLPSFTYEGKTYFSCVTPIFPTNVSYYTKNHTGNFVVCAYEMGAINFVPSGLIDSSNINMVITDSENNILLSSDINKHGSKISAGEIRKNFLYKSIPLSNLNWNVVVYMQAKNASVFSRLTLLFIIFMIIFTIAMLFLMLKLLNDIIVKRIELLKTSVEKISDNDTTYRIRYKYNDEYSIIITTINKVLDKLHKLNQEKISTLDRLYQTQLLQNETQIYYLFGQVSPHFLYNSLAHIQGLAYENNVPEIVDMVSSLSKVVRYFSTNQNLSTIKQDLDCAIEYFKVINSRRTNPIALINTVHADLLGVKCLKMIYQPILENTLKHAFSLDDSGTVIISSVENADKAIIEITDNGRGIPRDKLESIKKRMDIKDLNIIQSGNHIGFINVNMRLKLYYDNECGIEIISEVNAGTTVRIIFKKEPKKTDENRF